MSTGRTSCAFLGPSQNPPCCAVMDDHRPKALPSKKWSTTSLERGLSMVDAQQDMFQLDDTLNPMEQLAVSWLFSTV